MVKEILKVTLDDETMEYKTTSEIDGLDELNVISMLCESFKKRIRSSRAKNTAESFLTRALDGETFYWMKDGNIGVKKK